jgi:hypothetical protein
MTQHAGRVSDARRVLVASPFIWRAPAFRRRRPILPQTRVATFKDYAVRSQPILIIVLTQSSGKYNFHSRTFSAERMLSISFVRLAISVAFSEGCTCGTAKIGTRGEASKFIFLLRAGCDNAIPTGIAPCGLFGKPPMQKDTG